MNDYLKYAAGAVLFALWAALVFFLKMDPADLIGTIKLAILAIFGFTGITKLQAAPSGTPTSPPAAKSGLPTVPLKDPS